MIFARLARNLLIEVSGASYTKDVALEDGEPSLIVNALKVNGKETRNNYASI